ncbi:fumarate/nitrate reduction transcriptional regulator Fnr [Gayadomonas joobiniege]|uniref:fumarate/nitrate reduction transcriptional regulator Fnr n=1 Tax=Gayadomonas joobiniege TaxID=1234606 RepID=UPI00035FC633|nr:fumarate/nitrate reduction transcriptional regulator Fnr [Gayadomonas joobiniege]
MKHVASFSHAVTCQNCSLSQMCLPFSLNNAELNQLDGIIERETPLHKGEKLISTGDEFTALYAVRSGSLKSFTLSKQGDEQITSFHLPGDIIGFDGIGDQKHRTSSIALETSMICKIPYQTMDKLSVTLPKLRQQVMRLMSGEINLEQEMIYLLNKKTAEERIATFVMRLSNCYKERGLSASQFRLSMTRSEIGNYLGLTVETVSRLLSRFHKNQYIEVNGKFITILNFDKLEELAEVR